MGGWKYIYSVRKLRKYNFTCKSREKFLGRIIFSLVSPLPHDSCSWIVALVPFPHPPLWSPSNLDINREIVQTTIANQHKNIITQFQSTCSCCCGGGKKNGNCHQLIEFIGHSVFSWRSTDKAATSRPAITIRQFQTVTLSRADWRLIGQWVEWKTKITLYWPIFSCTRLSFGNYIKLNLIWLNEDQRLQEMSCIFSLTTLLISIGIKNKGWQFLWSMSSSGILPIHKKTTKILWVEFGSSAITATGSTRHYRVITTQGKALVALSSI